MSESDSTKDTLLHNNDAERSILGSLLKNGVSSQIMEMLTEEDFFMEPHRHIFGAILGLWYRGESVDPITVASELGRSCHSERAGGSGYITDLLNEAHDPASMKSHAVVIRDCSLRRQLVKMATHAAENARTSPSIQNVLAQSQRDLTEIMSGSIQSDPIPLRTVARENQDTLQRQWGRGAMLVGLPTGFQRLNAITLGYHKGDLIVVAGRPGMGKTAFAVNTAAYLTISQPYVGLFFSLEASKSQIGFRIQCANARVNLQRLSEGRISREEKRSLFFTAEKMELAKLFIDDTPAITLQEIYARALQVKQRHGLDFLVVDYLQLMGPHGKNGKGASAQQIGAFSYGLKRMARELSIPVIVLSQLSRRGEGRTKLADTEPRLSDLKGSGSIEQDADLVIFLSRPGYYDKNTDEKNLCNVIVAKQRNGPTESFWVGWSEEYGRFSDLSFIPSDE